MSSIYIYIYIYIGCGQYVAAAKMAPAREGSRFLHRNAQKTSTQTDPRTMHPPPLAHPGQLKKNTPNPHRFLIDLDYQNNSQNGFKILTKPSWNPDRIRTPFFSLSGTLNDAHDP